MLQNLKTEHMSSQNKMIGELILLTDLIQKTQLIELVN